MSALPLLSSISPTNKPALSRQRDHSACRRPDTPLKVRKTRENLKQHSIYADIPPPCVHLGCHDDHQPGKAEISTGSDLKNVNVLAQPDNVPSPRDLIPNSADNNNTDVAMPPASQPVSSRVQRQKSVSRRMLSRVKQGIASRSKSSHSIRPAESETSLVRRLSGRRPQKPDAERRSQSFEVSGGSTESNIDETTESARLAEVSVQRSFTNSTVSTAEVFNDSSRTVTPNEHTNRVDAVPTAGLWRASSSSPPLPSSPSPQPTPRPPPRNEPPSVPSHVASSTSLAVPCVDLYVVLDSTTVDIHSKRDVWIAIEATVRSICTKVPERPTMISTLVKHETLDSEQATHLESGGDIHALCESTGGDGSKPMCGAISTLRLCFKPVEGCQIRDIIGQKTLKDLTLGQQCSLFIKLRVPKIRVRDSTVDPDQESLFTELESIVGTLKTEILHVEARYRHTMLPSDNVVTVRHVCRIKRPKTDSRWSIAGQSETLEPQVEAHTMLARYLASRYPPEEALELLQRYLGPAATAQPGLRHIYDSLASEMRCQDGSNNGTKPSVIVTDIDLSSNVSPVPCYEGYTTAPSTSLVLNRTSLKPSIQENTEVGRHLSSDSSVTTTTLAPPLISAARITTALNIADSSSTNIQQGRDHMPSDAQDSARQLWRHIRRTSLSAKQLEEMTPERLQHIEANDDSIKELRRKALANKRSVGAETLRAWKWEESMQSYQHHQHGEAPWM